MTTSQIAIGPNLSQLIKEYKDDRYCLLELLLFWGRHPYTHFSRLAIIHALNSQKSCIERALIYLVAKGVVTAYVENDGSCFSLTEDESRRKVVLDLTRFNWYQWQAILRQVYPALAESKVRTEPGII